ncbi:hypothetical protein [Devosia sp. SD17-2]|uniref:hypothetical protein n=1 Tax=Devosia sp. SD17-2 TaxID=2976459 RepID=UPI0023D850BA|nr:hypothetical protein [Devosia sp. SD17-2]WEJ32270.1 hypothetical protein NYQ88_15390 [Devosia sp. SD17-2]
MRRETEYVAGLVGQVLNAQHRFGDMIQDKGKVSIDLVTVIQKALGVLEVGADLSVFHLDLRSPISPYGAKIARSLNYLPQLYSFKGALSLS